jgi:hypothetical protein
MAATAIAGQGVFSAAVMAGRAHVASPIARLVCMEVVEWLRPALREWAVIPVMGIEAVVYVAVKAMRSVKPGAGPDKDPAYKPVRPVVAVGGAVIRSIVKVSVGADWRHANVNADANLSRRHCRDSRGCEATEGNCKSRERKDFDFDHNFSLIRLEDEGEGVVAWLIRIAAFPFRKIRPKGQPGQHANRPRATSRFSQMEPGWRANPRELFFAAFRTSLRMVSENGRAQADSAGTGSRRDLPRVRTFACEALKT